MLNAIYTERTKISEVKIHYYFTLSYVCILDKAIHRVRCRQIQIKIDNATNIWITP